MFDTPILFLIFNRPDTTQEVFNRIREIKPKYLFVAADGPRKNKEGENEKCLATRAIINNIDWDCEVKTLFRDNNLGCKIAVSSAISWFFEHNEQGIILEDDCLPHPSFFRYCEQMLDKYKDDPKIYHIGGNNFDYSVLKKRKDSYFFSAYALIWGWATWKRAWEKYDNDIQDYDNLLKSDRIKDYLKSNEEIEYWRDKFNRIVNHNFDTWDFIWQYTIWKHGGKAIVPFRNMVKNIGFDHEATHTIPTGNYNPKAHLRAINHIIKTHPKGLDINRKEDVKTFKYNYLNQPTLKEKVLFKLKQIQRSVAR